MRRLLFAGAGVLALGAAQPQAHAGVVLTDGKGRVELLPGNGGRGLGVLPGEPLGAGVLSVEKGRAVLATDDGATLELEGARAQVTSAETTRVALERGKLSASGGSRALKVEAANGLSATATGAHFELALGDDGSLDIADTQGALQLAMGDAKVELAAGQKLHLDKGQPLYGPGSPSLAKARDEKPAPKLAAAEVPEKPAAKAEPAKPEPTPAPSPAPAAPQLSVKWPATAVFTTYTLRGTTAPGAKVSAGEATAVARKNGSFSLKLTLPEGESQVEVKVTAADGQQASESHALRAIAPPAKPAQDAAEPAKPAAGSEGADKPEVKQEGAGWE